MKTRIRFYNDTVKMFYIIRQDHLCLYEGCRFRFIFLYRNSTFTLFPVVIFGLFYDKHFVITKSKNPTL